MVLLLRSIDSFSYIPENESEQTVLVWNTSFGNEDPMGRGIKTSATSEDLYKVDEDYDNLIPDKAKMFHKIVAKTLYITKQARSDNYTAVALLTTRVRYPNKYDWGKLVHLRRFIRGTRDIPLILSVNVSGVLKFLIGESYAMYPKRWRNFHGKIISYRYFNQVRSKHPQFNIIIDFWSPQLHDVCIMAKVLCGISRIPSHGENVYQDNKSVILLEKNERLSSSKCTNNINISFFFITDCISKKELNVEWYPTNDMIVDYVTNHTQGSIINILET